MKRGETYDYCITGARLADFAVIKSKKERNSVSEERS